MNNEQKKLIADCMNRWVEVGNDNRSQRKLAKKIGISDATVSNMRKEKWENIGDKIWNKSASLFTSLGWMKLEQEDTWKFFDTPESDVIMKVLNNAKEYQRRAAIDGATGKGKSESIKQFVNRDRTNESFHIICRKAMNPKTFCINIAEQIGLTHFATNRYQLEEDIAEKLLSMNKPVLIFDELENLSLTCYSSIKAIIDLTDDQCGVVMVGIELWQLVHGNALKGKEAFRQIQRRFPIQSYEFLAEGIESKTMIKILIDCGIKNIYAQQWFEENIADYDALKNTVKDALRIAKRQNTEITREFLATLFATEKKRKSYLKLKHAA